jgi:hypothetical protein
MIGITIPPPSILIEIRYDYYQKALDEYYKKSYAPLHIAYQFIDDDVSHFHNAVVKIIPDSVRVHTPVSSGQLSQSIEAFVPGGKRPGPNESLHWAGYYEGVWHDTTETLPRYYYETFACYSNAYYMNGMSYAMPVETGSAPHTPPAQHLSQWTHLQWTAPDGGVVGADPSAVWKLQALIKARGTPIYAMFWKGLALAQSEILFNTSGLLKSEYWTIERSEYHLSPIEV